MNTVGKNKTVVDAKKHNDAEKLNQCGKNTNIEHEPKLNMANYTISHLKSKRAKKGFTRILIPPLNFFMKFEK